MSLGYTRDAGKVSRTRINTELLLYEGSLSIIQASFGHRIRDQGVGGSNPLSPTNYFQSLTILQILQIEPLVRRLWVPQLKCRFQQGLGSLDE
jgi:hypothetical protein